MDVQDSPDFRRVRDLPRRAGECPDLSPYLHTANGKGQLRPVQSLALHDAGVIGGLLAPIKVGGGKTLISFLLPEVMRAQKPLLLLPAGLVEKTKRDQQRYSKDWRVSRHLRIMSYEMLGRLSSENFLNLYKPDLVIADEAHRLKNKKAACTRRVKRYLQGHPDCKFIAMSGTLIKHGIADVAHLAAWALGEQSPFPLEEGTVNEWSGAIDVQTNPLLRVGPGVLGSTQEAAREWLRDRLENTPGVVCSLGGGVSCSLQIRYVEHPVNEATESNFQTLRRTWCRPDGWALSQAVEIWRVARELAAGIHYAWDPFGPPEWLSARKAWAAFVRETIRHSRALDSELAVRTAVEAGDLEDDGVLDAWLAIKDTFKINSIPVWHDDSCLRFCEQWAKDRPGIVWVEHAFFAEELSRRTGMPYFREKGFDSRGKYIESEDGKRSIIASTDACGTGVNLQYAFSRNLFVSMMGCADAEQIIGRTHRDGQEADTVEVDIIRTCLEHDASMRKALEEARMVTDTVGDTQKLLLADLDWPDACIESGCRWRK